MNAANPAKPEIEATDITESVLIITKGLITHKGKYSEFFLITKNPPDKGRINIRYLKTMI